MDRAVHDHRLGEVETDEALGIDRRAELLERNARREVRRRGREEVAAVERPRDRLERVRRIRELVGLSMP